MAAIRRNGRHSADGSGFLWCYRGRWYFRRFVPADVADRVVVEPSRKKVAKMEEEEAVSLGRAMPKGRSQPCWKVSLRTTDSAVARQNAKTWIKLTDAAIKRARLEIDRERLENERRQWARLELTEEQRDLLDSAGGLEALAAELEHLRAAEPWATAAAEMLGSVAQAPRTALVSEGVDPDNVRYEAAVAQAQAATLREQIRESGEAITRADGKAWRRVPAPNDPDRATLSIIIGRWARETEAPAQHVEQYAYPCQRFRELHGDLEVKEITKKHIRGFADILVKLPRSTAKEVRAGDIHAAIRFGEENKLPKLSSRTVNKHLTALGTMLAYAERWGFIDANPAARLPLIKTRTKVSGQKSRMPFTPAQTKAIFQALEAAFPKRDTADFWVPFVAAYQGMRLEEVCQLDKGDLRKEGGIWVILVTDEGDKRLKNDGSHRVIPLHPHLQDMGFTEYAATSKGPKLFSDLAPDRRGRWGGPYGKRFARFLDTKVKISDPTLTFHSFRHAWKDAARNAGLPEDVQNRIMGHQHGTVVASNYGTGHSVRTIVPWLAKVDPVSVG